MASFQIDCPNCGARSAQEFAFSGEAIALPSGRAETAEENYERVWLRENTDGPQTERWFHRGGCGRWLTVTRNALTNEILEIRTRAPSKSA